MSWPDNYPEENIYRERMRAYLNHAAALLVKEANAMGFVLTISQQPAGPTPAIGRTTTVISVNSKRIQAS